MERKKGKDIYPIAENIRKIMNDRRLTQSAMAQYAEMPEPQFSLAINGHRPFSLEYLSKLATGLGMRLIDIFTYPEVYQPVKTDTEELTASITIQLKDEKKEQALKLLFGDENLKLLNLK